MTVAVAAAAAVAAVASSIVFGSTLRFVGLDRRNHTCTS